MFLLFQSNLKDVFRQRRGLDEFGSSKFFRNELETLLSETLETQEKQKNIYCV